MIRLLLLVLLCPLWATGQGIGVLASIGPGTLTGPNGSYSDAPGWRVGVWGEYASSSRIGLYGDLAYTQRRGAYLPDTEVSGMYVCIGAMPRLKVAATDGNALVLGLGGYIGVYADKGEGATDAGLYCSLGVEWLRGGASLFLQRGAVGISSALDGSTRWSQAGISVLVNLKK
jgi:hypothetical protein